MGGESIDNDIGKVFGCYKVIADSGTRDSYGKKLYKVQCVYCNIERNMKLTDLRQLKSNKCLHYHFVGNLKIPIINFKNSRLKKVLNDMIDRCYNVNCKSYKYYGQKGIALCNEWINNPKTFENWAITHGYKNNLTIDRIDESKNYCPENCRFVSLIENARYKSSTNYITANITLSGREWARLLGKNINYVNKMIRNKGLNDTIEYIQNQLKDKHTINQ